MKLMKLVLIATTTMGMGSAFAEPADILKFDDSVWMGFDAEGTTLYYHDWSRVDTNSKSGNVKYSSHGRVAEGSMLPDKPMKFQTGHMGFICASDAPYFQYVITPSGKASIKCQSWPFKDDLEF